MGEHRRAAIKYLTKNEWADALHFAVPPGTFIEAWRRRWIQSASKESLETENPRRGRRGFWDESETVGELFRRAFRSRVDLLTDRVKRSLSLFDAHCG